jgi:hypothetical protein
MLTCLCNQSPSRVRSCGLAKSPDRKPRDRLATVFCGAAGFLFQTSGAQGESACVTGLQSPSTLTGARGVWNLQCLFYGPHETEGVASDINAIDRLRDLWHMARNAFVARAARSVMRVLLEAGGMRPVLRVGAVAGKAQSVAPLTHNSRIVVAMRVVATETRNADRHHLATCARWR